jgi:hypothetical protein
VLALGGGVTCRLALCLAPPRRGLPPARGPSLSRASPSGVRAARRLHGLVAGIGWNLNEWNTLE